MTAKLAVGYLHVGQPQHGVSRYGRLLAAEARSRPELLVREAELLLDGHRKENRRRLLRAAGDLAGADVVHLQYNSQLVTSVWGPGWSQLANLRAFVQRVRAPLAVSVHDLFPPASLREIGELTRTKIALLAQRRLAKLVRSPVAAEEVPSFGLRSKVRRNFRPEAVTLRWLARGGRQLIVCSQEERERLHEFLPDAAVTVIPHFVETRALPTRPDDAKRALGLGDSRVVTLLGYIHPRKGHVLLVDAMPYLPADVVVVFAGGAAPEQTAYLTELLNAARATGTAERLRVTGYLPESELEQYLAATDLAVCPFTDASASGSLSTWISVQKPVLASDLPLISEYNSIEPGAIVTFQPYTAAAFSAAICRLLNTGQGEMNAAIGRLREKLSISRMLARHVSTYELLLGSDGTGR
jgi:glycosyltransferase involved in cell wall biosynthesis